MLHTLPAAWIPPSAWTAMPRNTSSTSLRKMTLSKPTIRTRRCQRGMPTDLPPRLPAGGPVAGSLAAQLAEV
eukprot:4717379-Lingulodinium_polyedra.AAC.1